MTQTVLITGANRGIGLELVRQYAHDGWYVMATCRDPNNAKELQEMEWGAGRIEVYPLDVTNQDSIEGLARTIKDHPIDCLINNAGIAGKWGAEIEDLETDMWLDILHTNTIAPVMVARTFLPNLKRSQRKLIAAISSRMGSIQDNTSGREYMYRTSKAGVNMAMKSLAIDLKPEGITVVTLHPGWVKTDMGTDQAPLLPQESVSGLREVLTNATLADTGRFLNYDGTELPW